MFRALRTTVAATALALGWLAPPPASAVAVYPDPVLSTGLAPSVVNFSDSAVASVSWMRIAVATPIASTTTSYGVQREPAGSPATTPIAIPGVTSTYAGFASDDLVDALVDAGGALQAVALDADASRIALAGRPEAGGAPMPEPSTLALIALCLTALGWILRRRPRSA